mmetsp:Transcript_44554/g.89485  ORF Transcript_44554/g.89485 Transcript_44554/m.89485 type:complete len:278 (-) Transcript_44554:105-938(-)
MGRRASRIRPPWFFLLILIAACPASRKCHFCKVQRATMGVCTPSEESSRHGWKSILCGQCVQDYEGPDKLVALARRCLLCPRFASFGLPNARRPTYCSGHKTAHSVDIVHTSLLCSFEGCAKQAIFGQVGAHELRCGEHKLRTDTDLRSKKCSHSGCQKRATHGRRGSRAVRCAEHKEEEEISLRHKLCAARSCYRRPSFGTREDGISRFCRQHKRPSDVDVQSRRNKHPEGVRPAATKESTRKPKPPRSVRPVASACRAKGNETTDNLKVHSARAS